MTGCVGTQVNHGVGWHVTGVGMVSWVASVGTAIEVGVSWHGVNGCSREGVVTYPLVDVNWGSHPVCPFSVSDRSQCVNKYTRVSKWSRERMDTLYRGTVGSRVPWVGVVDPRLGLTDPGFPLWVLWPPAPNPD